MTRLKPKSLLILVLLLAAVIAVAGFSGCIFDPWPEPGEATGGDMASGDSDDDDDPEGSDNDNGWELVDGSLIYCSPPSEDGNVTVVGVAGAIGGGDTIIVTGTEGQEAEFEKYENGSFAGRIEAEAGETLFVSVEDGGDWSDPTEVSAGTLEGSPADGNIVDPADVPSPDADGLVYIHGENDDSYAEVIVVGGNINLSAGSDADMDCTWGNCIFDLYIPADAGDEVDLFLVHVGENSGYTEPQTVVIPAP